MSFERPREHAIDADTAVSEESAVCAYCGHPFVREEHLALHRGLSHPTELDEKEREAFEDAYAAEAEDIRLFQLKAIFVLVVIYFVFVMVYLLV